MDKHPIDVTALRTDTTNSLADACLDYLYMEHEASKEALEARIIKSLEQRLQTGESVFVVIERVRDDGNGNTEIVAKADYSLLSYEHPERVLSGMRFKETDGSGTGEFILGIPLTQQGDQQIKPAVSNKTLGQCPRFVVTSINKTAYHDAACKLVLSLRTGYTKGQPFLYRQSNPTLTNEPEITEQDLFILDKSPGDYTAASARQVLEHDTYNALTTLLDNARHGTFTNTTTAFNQPHLHTFTNWLGQDTHTITTPNTAQQSFITDTNHELSLLQGPPGTGKTSLATAPAILARLLAFAPDRPCRTVVTGPSNKAIDELMTDTLTIANEYVTDDTTGSELDNTLFVRLSDDEDTVLDSSLRTTLSQTILDNTVFTGLRGNAKQSLADITARLTTTNPPQTDNIVVFGTARRTWKLGKRVITEFGYTDTHKDAESTDTPPANGQHQLFDMLVVDEASMMTLPDYLTVGGFYNPGGTILIAGDHRQLPPVQKYEWSTDHKPTLLKTAPFLSVLNYHRLLRGDDIDRLTPMHEQLLAQTDIGNTTIPLHQLRTTYRCHRTMAGFLRRWVYQARDGIEYTSTVTDTLAHTPNTNALTSAVFDTNAPLTLITYPHGAAQQANSFEAWLTTALLTTLQTEYEHTPTTPPTTGVITPHNAQRGLLERYVTQTPSVTQTTPTTQSTPNSTQLPVAIDTVERFQGGERDLMIVNGTVSDPDYVDNESTFLLALNRLNVSLSRMKKHCIVIASTAVFDHIPLDTDEYADAALWKGLSQDAGIHTTSPTFTDVASDYLPTDIPDTVSPEPPISVYHVTRE